MSGLDVSALIERNAAFYPDKTAIRFEGRSLSYAGLAERIGCCAAGLVRELGVERGDRVAVLAHNHPDILVLLYACARIGAIMVPVNWRLAGPEIGYILAHAGAKALVLERAFAGVLAWLDGAQPGCRAVGIDFVPEGGLCFEALAGAHAGGSGAPRSGPEAPLLIVYTSGTTGRPKGAVLTQDALIWNAVQSHHMHRMTASDHILTALPMFHVGGLNIQTTPALQCGATVTLHARFAPGAVLAALAGDRPSLTVLVPATIQALIEHEGFAGADLSCLRAVTTGSTIVPLPLLAALEARGVPVLQVYGSTETAPVCAYTCVGGERSADRGGTTGLAGIASELRIVDDAGRPCAAGMHGEILVRGPTVLAQYWRDPEATAAALEDGWLHTGDIGSVDADGYLFVHDRKKNMIISGGENVYPAEIERVLCEHPAVLEVAVIGRPDPRWQQVPVAFVALRAGGAVDADALIAFAAARLARFKLPRAIRFVDRLERNAMGKVQHFLLAEQLAAEMDMASGAQGRGRSSD